MGTITFQVTEGGQPNATKTFNVADADIDRFVAAWQADANTAVNGTATRGQVLLTWANVMMTEAKGKISQFERQAQQAALPPIIDITAT